MSNTSDADAPTPVQRDADVDDNTVYQAIAAELNGYYTSIITVSSLFLGGVLTLLTAIEAVPAGGMTVLALGCGSLIAAIGFTASARWATVRAGRYSFAQDERFGCFERRSVICAQAALWCFLLGLLLTSVGVFLTVMENDIGRETKSQATESELTLTKAE